MFCGMLDHLYYIFIFSLASKLGFEKAFGGITGSKEAFTK